MLSIIRTALALGLAKRYTLQMAGTKRALNWAGLYNMTLTPNDMALDILEVQAHNTFAAGDAVGLFATGFSASGTGYSSQSITPPIQVIQMVAATNSQIAIGVALDAGVAGANVRVVLQGPTIVHGAGTITADDALAAGNNAGTTGSGTVATATAVTSGLCIGYAINGFTTGQFGWAWVQKQ